MTAPLFPFAPDGASVITLAKALSTDIMPAGDGGEIRHGNRSVAPRMLSYSIVLIDTLETMQFLSTWIGADQPLRYSVPVWPVCYIPTDITGADVTVERAPGTRLSSGDRVLLWQSDQYCEEAEVDSVAGSVVTLTAPPTLPFVVGAARLVPIMTAWIDPPTVNQQCSIGETLDVTFNEELPGIAGEDATVTGQVTAVAASAVLNKVRGSTADAPFTHVWKLTVFDADGMQIPAPNAIWEVNEGLGWLPAETTVTFAAQIRVSPDKQYYVYDSRSGSSGVGVRVTVDGITLP